MKRLYIMGRAVFIGILFALLSSNGYASVIVSLQFDNCMAPIPNAGTYTNAGTMNGKPYFTKGNNLRIIWTGTQWEIQGDDPAISSVNWYAGWYNTNNTPYPPQTEWASNAGCIPPTLSGDETSALCNMTASASHTNVSCFGGNNGTATVTVSNGNGGYTYSWTPSGGTGATATGLSAGTYTCTVTDAASCQANANVTITEPSEISVTSTNTDVLCFGNATGAIDLTVSGGTPSYTYNWGGGITSEDRNNLTAGTYSVTVTDNNGCTKNSSISVIQPAAALDASTNVTDIACFGGSNGAIDLTATGGTAPYTYNWGGGITSEDRSNLTVGSYSVVITDNHGCFYIGNATVSQPASLSVSASHTDNSCNGGNDGTATVNVSGGTAPYNYNWSPNGGTAATATGLIAGTYTCNILDANSCPTSGNVTINEPSIITGTDVQNICIGSSYTFNGITYSSNNNTATDTLTSANGCDSFVTLNLTVTEDGIVATDASSTATQYNDTAHLASSDCKIIATIVSNTDLGTITSSVTVGAIPSSNGDPYVSRYYDIHTSQPGSGTVTLYYTQQEFDDYNSLVGAANPDYPQIGTNGENLQITAFHSLPGSGNGPGGYDTAADNVEVIPCTAAWNASDNRWEITFTTSQFSGFFLHTKSDGSPLPINLKNISAVNTGSVNIIKWSMADNEQPYDFDIESSKDGKTFKRIGSTPGENISGYQYSYTDIAPFTGINYYRLHFITDGMASGYSSVVSAYVNPVDEFKISTYPNPFNESILINIKGEIQGVATLTISDMTGKVIRSIPVSSKILTISMGNTPSGMYYIYYRDSLRTDVIKVIKK